MRFLLLLFSLPLLAQEELRLGVNESRTLKVPGLSKAAVGNGKLIKARVVGSGELLLTGLKAGRTTVHAWGIKEESFSVRVVASEASVSNGVVQATLEFLEMDGSISKSLGVHWPEAIQFSGAGSTGSEMSGLNYSAAFSSARGWIKHMIREGWAKLLAHPELYVRMGEEAVFSSGGEFPVSTSSENYGRYQKHVEWKPFGLIVKVRPQSGDNLNIFSDIDIEISEVDSSHAIDGIPALSKRHLQTKMESREGETVILSGLIRQSSSHEKHSLPLLAHIPLLGPLLFSSENDSNDESEIFMAVTFSLSTREKQETRQQTSREKFSRFGKEE